MKYAQPTLWAIIIVQLLVIGGIAARQTLRTPAAVPDQQLNDPLIMPELRQLASAAESGGAEQWTRFAQGLLGKGFYAHAEVAFAESLRRRPRSITAQFGLAFSLDRLGRMQESSRQYERVVQLPAQSPDDALTHAYALYAIGRNALRLEQPEVAQQWFTRNDSLVSAVYQTAKLPLRAGRIDAALPIIEAMLREMPDALEFHFLHHRALLAQQRPREAFRAAAVMEWSSRQVAVNFNTQYVAPLDQMTAAARLIGQHADKYRADDPLAARESLQQIKQQLGPRPIFATRVIDQQRLAAAVAAAAPDEIFALLAERRAAGQCDAAMLEAEGDAWMMRNRPGRAAACWRRALRLTPSAAVHRKLAQYHDDDDAQRRDHHLGHAALLDALAELDAGQPEAALPSLQEATGLIPDAARPWYYIGEVHFFQNRRQAARDAYRQCLQRRPTHGRAADKLAYLEEELEP